MNINNPLVKFVMFGNPKLRYRVERYGEIDVCTLFWGVIFGVVSAIVITLLFTLLIAIPAGYVIGELIGAIVTGHWTVNSAYGFAAYFVGGILAIGAAIFGIACICIWADETNDYKGNNWIVLMFKAIKEKTCYKIEIQK